VKYWKYATLVALVLACSVAVATFSWGEKDLGVFVAATAAAFFGGCVLVDQFAARQALRAQDRAPLAVSIAVGTSRPTARDGFLEMAITILNRSSCDEESDPTR